MFTRKNLLIKSLLLTALFALVASMTTSVSGSDGGVIGTYYLAYKKAKTIYEDDMYGEKKLTVTNQKNNPSDSKMKLYVYRSGGQGYDKPCPVIGPGESAPVHGDVRKIVAMEIGHNSSNKTVVIVSQK